MQNRAEALLLTSTICLTSDVTAEPKRPKVQELCESRGVFRPNEPYGFCGRKAALNQA